MQCLMCDMGKMASYESESAILSLQTTAHTLTHHISEQVALNFFNH